MNIVPSTMTYNAALSNYQNLVSQRFPAENNTKTTFHSTSGRGCSRRVMDMTVKAMVAKAEDMVEVEEVTTGMMHGRLLV